MQRWKAKKFAFGDFPRNASGASRQLRACLLSHEKREKITPVIQAIVVMNSHLYGVWKHFKNLSIMH